MQTKAVDRWIWILIYGGLLGLGLGWFLQPSSAAAAWLSMVVGAAAVAAGALLIFVRSRMGP